MIPYHPRDIITICWLQIIQQEMSSKNQRQDHWKQLWMTIYTSFVLCDSIYKVWKKNDRNSTLNAFLDRVLLCKLDVLGHAIID